MGMKIVHYPHPALRHQARPLTCIDKKLHLHVGAMWDAMYEAKGLGLAATQVALPYQLLLINITGDPNQKDREEVYINPVIVERKGTLDGEEGCLSFPGLFQKVRRAKTITVQAYNLKGEAVEVVASDLAARAWQHEIDHLGGVLFIDKMGMIAKLAARSSVKAFERDFKRAQARGEIPPDVELKKLLAALEAQEDGFAVAKAADDNLVRIAWERSRGQCECTDPGCGHASHPHGKQLNWDDRGKTNSPQGWAVYETNGSANASPDSRQILCHECLEKRGMNGQQQVVA
jgi:peptide deformylase